MAIRQSGCSAWLEGRPDVAETGYDRHRSHGTAHRRGPGRDGAGVHGAVQSRPAPGAGALPRRRPLRAQRRTARLCQRLQEQDARHYGWDGDRRRPQSRWSRRALLSAVAGARAPILASGDAGDRRDVRARRLHPRCRQGDGRVRPEEPVVDPGQPGCRSVGRGTRRLASPAAGRDPLSLPRRPLREAA